MSEEGNYTQIYSKVYEIKADPEHLKRFQRFSRRHYFWQGVMCWLRPWRWHKAPPWEYNRRMARHEGWWLEPLEPRE